MSFKERKKPRKFPGQKETRAATRRKELFFFLTILCVLVTCYDNIYIEEMQ
nr:MAG TPA_asm: hypothetical protein [Caudoviricetes sp.]DAR36071.1 MAG TPA: hypothetical protein [Caudoviricetes sp.]